MARAMKDSGIEWIGSIPESWHVDKVKYHLRRNEPRNPGNQVVLSVYREYGVIPKDSRDDNHNVTSDDTSKYKYVKPGNLVINKMKAWQGSMGVSSYEGIVSPAYFIYEFVDNDVYDKYLHYLFRSCYRDEFRRISGGIREGQWDLSPDLFAVTLFLVPDKQEQISIVKFLDNKCAEIDALMADVQAQIETLEQYKRSVITEAVTKGLNPNVPLKESGIDWIARIPEHWKSVPFQYVLIERNERNSPAKTDERLSLSIGLGVTLYADKTTNLDRFKEDVSQYKLAYPGDLVMNSMNMIVGATGISDYFGCVSPAYYTFYDNTNDHVVAKYCEYLFLTPMVMGELHKLGKGIMFIERGDGRVNTCRLKVSRYDLGHLKIPLPDIEEIRSIVSTLDTKCAEIDAIIDGKRQQLAVLEDYKKSVIFEYVTGKKEVPVA